MTITTLICINTHLPQVSLNLRLNFQVSTSTQACEKSIHRIAMDVLEVQEPELATPELYLSLIECFAPNVDPEQERHADKSKVIADVSSFIADSNAPHRKSAERIIPLLDALAAVCVQWPGQTFAVTMSLSPEEVKLYVAENSEVVSRDVVEHLMKIWNLVREINAKFHASAPPSLSSDQLEAPPTFTLDPLITPLVREIEREIYAFSFVRLKKRFEKRWALMKEFLKFLVSTKEISSNLGGMFLRLARQLDQPECPHSLPPTLRDIREELKSTRFFEREDQWAIREKDFLNEKQARATKQDGNIGSNGGLRLNAHRHISKLLSLGDHIEAIIRVASSRRLSSYIHSSTFEVEAIQPYTRTNININTPPDFVEQIARSIFPVDDPSREKKICQVVDTASGWYRYDKSETYNAHCECTLLFYHLEHPEKPPLRYIGVSKSLCLGCKLFIDAYNSHATHYEHQPIYYRSTHWKPYRRWISVLPRHATSERNHDFLTNVVNTMSKKAEHWLKERMETEIGSKRYSDSTTASERPDVFQYLDSGKNSRVGSYDEEWALENAKESSKVFEVLVRLWRGAADLAKRMGQYFGRR
ncbi:hypothetical protein BOTBODRAFT_365022 [Botryobasidium botryosum FD-172 SS1]|uniref:Uncharacterized protein n=1 Tax=Botryobasidium botryosum (strain FD-172 SS1) TaxID=930990 RepID=A0A067MD45_BOTB1|nr:hypothetical protein BOTBODRAFT_365022 [Botryobasidium botryosum FD-172 SS1]